MRRQELEGERRGEEWGSWLRNPSAPQMQEQHTGDVTVMLRLEWTQQL